jgi:pimeloyl-ACP methyl ester carboxylesterase
MPKVRTDDGIEINYDLDDFTNPWDGVTETIGLLHGSTMNMKFYAPMVPYLARNHRVLRWEQRGRGESTAPPPGSTLSGAKVDDNVTVGERFAKDALCVLDHLGIKKINWVGDSSGGITGAYFALMFPDRIKSLVCIQSPLVKIPDEFVKAWSAGEKDVATAIKKYGMEGWYDRVGTEWVTDPNKGNEKFKAWQRAERKKIATHVYVGHWMWQPITDLTPRLPQIKVPTLFITGENSKICPLEQQYRQQKLVPNSKIIVYKNVGHGVAFLEPERVAQDILKFLAAIG